MLDKTNYRLGSMSTYRVMKSRELDFLLSDLNSRLKHVDVFSVGPKIFSGGHRLQLNRCKVPLMVVLMALSCEDTWKTADGYSGINTTTILIGRSTTPNRSSSIYIL